jgi:hypothetical protein
MREEIDQIVKQIKDRDDKCTLDMQRILTKLSHADNLKSQING